MGLGAGCALLSAIAKLTRSQVGDARSARVFRKASVGALGRFDRGHS